MAGCFVTQKLSSWMCRSKSLLGDHASASLRAGAPITTTASEVGISTLSNRFHGAEVHTASTALNNRGIHDYAAVKRTFSSNATTGHGNSGGAEIAARQAQWDTETAAWKATRDAKAAAWEARKAAVESKIMKSKAASERTEMWFWGYICFSCTLGIIVEVLGKRSSRRSSSSSSC